MTSGGTGGTHLADAKDVEQWAERVGARTDFPKLVRRLIHQTNDQVVELEMRAAEGAGYAGYDGEVRASRGTPFVPEGHSVWELGVGESPAGKAEEDYAKRTSDPLGVDQSQATFVFVTAQRWSGKKPGRLRNEMRGSGATCAPSTPTISRLPSKPPLWCASGSGN